ncbi:unnamed protein product [Kuraishia capsulata CBS 1993]|uniref:Inositol polyphosphate-related phosphatase domain-containing protein n=1 Tax=Kuraishia capsulata CBS 1993 TaxID=1382522 RepID=W6MNU5_9ASCO|nr:uncharacterized protein KUCA_T00003928001 [Kuraishia capsulata CBS 1993]CDK27948.1 unnamed protein product [Kuraishia capsulata CBS 1993]
MSKKTSIPIFLFTFNCAKTNQATQDLEDALGRAYPQAHPPPSLLVFGFQEICSVIDSTSYATVNQHVIQMNDFLLGSLSARYGSDYSFSTVGINHTGSVALIVITPYPSKVSQVKTANMSCGRLLSSTKGGAGVRLKLRVKESENPVGFTFVAAHFMAAEGEKYLLRRNQNYLTLLQGMDFGDGFGVIKPRFHCFFMGDLNYRASGGFHGKHRPSSRASESERLISDFESTDELSIYRTAGEVFWGFEEPPVTFKPTYKFKVGTSEYTSKRVPSWCDRILYQNYTEEYHDTTEPLERVLEYNSIPSLKTSDHIPVYLNIEVPTDPPLSIVNNRGYLIDASGISVDNIYLKPTKLTSYYSKFGIATDVVFRAVLLGLLTNTGRIVLAVLVLFLVWVFRF